MNREQQGRAFKYTLATVGIAVAVVFLYRYPSWGKQVFGFAVLCMSMWILITTYTRTG